MTERIAYETMTDFIHSFRFLPAPSPPQLNPFPKLFICPPSPQTMLQIFPIPQYWKMHLRVKKLKVDISHVRQILITAPRQGNYVFYRQCFLENLP